MTDATRNYIRTWWLLNYGFVLFLSFTFLLQAEPVGALAWGYAVAVWLTYALVYLLPAIVIGWMLFRLLYTRQPRGYWLLLILLVGGSYMLIFADGRLFGLFGFHINSFVINLVTTPGGIASLGSSKDAEMTFVCHSFTLSWQCELRHYVTQELA